MSLRQNMSRFAATLADPALRGRASMAVTLGAAFAALCGAFFMVDTPSSLAEGGLFDLIFGGGRHYAAAPMSAYPSGGGYSHHSRRHAHRHHGGRRYAHHRRDRSHYARHAHLLNAANRHAAIADATPISADVAAQAPQAMSRRSVCVRTCDGYFFPIANYSGSSDTRSHEATCEKMCPGAETKLYVLPAGSDKIEEATAARGGGLYQEISLRANNAEKKGGSCSCHSVAGDPVESQALLNDFTLRPGDSVVTSRGVRVFRGGRHYPHQAGDFLSLAETRDIPRSTRGALAMIERALKTPHGRMLSIVNDRRHRRHGENMRSDRSLDFNTPGVTRIQ